MKPLKWKTLGDFKAERKRRRTPAALAKNEECCGPLNLVKSDRRGRRAIKPEVGINDNSFRVIHGNNHTPGGEREREREMGSEAERAFSRFGMGGTKKFDFCLCLCVP
jgi:uncharacterized short protein YbdD (DUF466 family)